MSPRENAKNADYGWTRGPEDPLFRHTTTHNCFTDNALREYRVRQREHGVRRIRDQVVKLGNGEHATGSRDFGRGFAHALRLVGEILDAEVGREPEVSRELWESGRYGWGTVNLVTDDRMPTNMAILVSQPVCSCGHDKGRHDRAQDGGGNEINPCLECPCRQYDQVSISVVN